MTTGEGASNFRYRCKLPQPSAALLHGRQRFRQTGSSASSPPFGRSLQQRELPSGLVRSLSRRGRERRRPEKRAGVGSGAKSTHPEDGWREGRFGEGWGTASKEHATAAADARCRGQERAAVPAVACRQERATAAPGACRRSFRGQERATAAAVASCCSADGRACVACAVAFRRSRKEADASAASSAEPCTRGAAAAPRSAAGPGCSSVRRGPASAELASADASAFTAAERACSAASAGAQ